MSTPHPVIAIDGPAASGKSSVAKRIAARLGWRYVNTGNMYRVVTWAVLDKGVDLADGAGIADLAAALPLTFTDNADRHILTTISGIVLDDAALNSEDVNRAVSFVAQVPVVRERLVSEQRALISGGPVVMEGRDIGSVVFPDTPLKLYIDASEEVRARRRQVQGHQDAVSLRDKMDSTRKTAPLVIPQGATRIDSSDMTLGQVVDAACDELERRGVKFPA